MKSCDMPGCMKPANDTDDYCQLHKEKPFLTHLCPKCAKYGWTVWIAQSDSLCDRHMNRPRAVKYRNWEREMALYLAERGIA